MCLSPFRLESGQEVACRDCDLCRDNRKNDFVGRCIAEKRSSKLTLTLTLTYSGDGPESAVLRYTDVQAFIRAIRDAGFPVRYICCGEYGTKKGRAHWHIILFFPGRHPKVPAFDRRVSWKYWPHGFVYFQQPDYRGFKYVVKYALKPSDVDGWTKAVTMSKKPPLGHAFFMKLADDLARQALPVHSPEYSFADVLDRDKKPRRFWLQGRMREMFLERYVQSWAEHHGTHPPETDFLMEGHFDKIARREMEIEAVNSFGILPREEDEIKSHIRPPRQQIGYLAFPGRQGALAVAYDDGTADILIGAETWTLENDASNVTGENLLLRQLARSSLKPSFHGLAETWLRSLWARSSTPSP